jgi:hypothetical protein
MEPKESIMKFAEAGIEGLETVTGGWGNNRHETHQRTRERSHQRTRERSHQRTRSRRN